MNIKNELQEQQSEENEEQKVEIKDLLFLLIMSIVFLSLGLSLTLFNTNVIIDTSQLQGINKFASEIHNQANFFMKTGTAISYFLALTFLFQLFFKLNDYNLNSLCFLDEQQSEEVNTIEEKIEVKVEIFKFNLDFENSDLNLKIKNIEDLINSIISLPVLENDSENKILISSTQEKYIQQIHMAYITIPKKLREKNTKRYTATQLALEQLILIENGLLDVEKDLLEKQMKDLAIMDRFIKENFSEEKSYLTMTV